MLHTLRIRNLALVAELTLDFGPGLSVLTGETGAGKSVILGALNLVLGQRADRGAIRAGADQCTVEAAFDISRLRPPLSAFLEENGLEPCADGQLVLKRSFSSAGANRQFVNGSPTTLAALTTLGAWLVDLHGPHEHQSLLQPHRQLAILDAFGNLETARQSLAELVRQRNAAEAELAALVIDERTYAQQLDLTRHQVREITDARLQSGEDATVAAEHHRAHHAARRLELSLGALDALSESEDAATTRLAVVGRALQELVRLDPTAQDLADGLDQAVSLLRDVQHGLVSYGERAEVDPGRLAELEQRLDLLQSLKRKYGPTLDEVQAFGVTAREKLAALEGRSVELTRINTLRERLQREILTAARKLSQSRQAVIPRLVKAVQLELSALGFRQSEFAISVTFNPDGIQSSGGDVLEFQFAPNPGEPARPLRAIASSGELARVMLALKTVLAAEDEVPVLVFDEVDANIGGETAHAVGEKMRQIARQHQVLCITHLAPVAAHGDAHFVVTKDVAAGRTESQVTQLKAAGRVDELARMLGGGPAARRHAEELLNQRKKTKTATS